MSSFVQLDYTDQPGGLPGQPADFNPRKEVTRTVEGVDIPFGRAVGRGTILDEQVVLGIGAGIVGVALEAKGRESTIQNSGVIQYVEGDDASIIYDGNVLVVAAEAVAVADPVWIDDATGEFFMQAAGGRTQLPTATFETAGALDDTVTVRVRNL